MSGPDSPPDRIQLLGLRALGCHGVLPEEQGRPQPFEVDLELELDLHRAGQSDALIDSVDYGTVGRAAIAIVEGTHAQLIEHLAERIAASALQAGAPHTTAVTVCVRKTRPPVPFEMRSAGVTIHRRRAT
jgi:dihydroneopterin aldolase